MVVKEKKTRKINKKELLKENKITQKIEKNKTVLIKTEIKEQREDKTLCLVKYNEDYENLATLVWFNNEHIKTINNITYLEGEVLEINNKDIEIIYSNGTLLFTLTFNKNMIKEEL